jgi:hypothetical protein
MTQTPEKPTPPPEDTHPYGVRIALVLGSNVDLELHRLDTLLPFGVAGVITIRQSHTNPREQANKLQRVSVQLEGFRTAGEAEAAGQRLSLAVLWSGVSKGFTLTFERWAGAFPFVVYDRTQGGGISVRAEGRVFQRIAADEFQRLALEAYEKGIAYDPSVVVSMELFTSARLEMSERARFITLVTALEALSVQVDYGDDVATALEEAVKVLVASKELEGEEKDGLRASLSGRLRQLRQESVRQAINRVVRDHLKDREAVRFVDDAYGVRSKMLHEGLRVANLHELTTGLEAVLRRLYSAIVGLPLARPV